MTATNPINEIAVIKLVSDLGELPVRIVGMNGKILVPLNNLLTGTIIFDNFSSFDSRHLYFEYLKGKTYALNRWWSGDYFIEEVEPNSSELESVKELKIKIIS